MTESDSLQSCSKVLYSDKENSNESDIWDYDSVKDKDYSEVIFSSDTSDSSYISNKANRESSTKILVQREKPLSPNKKSKTKWRQTQVEARKINKRKMRRDSGQTYINKTGNTIENRKMGPPCSCKKKCRTLFKGQESRIFHSFWDMANYNVQNSYLFSSIKVSKPKRRYPKKTKKAESARKATHKYYVKINGEDVKICKQEFLSVHGLQNSQKRIQLLCEQMTQGRTTPKSDKRGKHGNRHNKIPEEVVQSIKDHINSIPKYTSHYSRQRNPEKLYFDCDLNISSLYNDYYLDWCKNRNLTPASEDKYRRTFCTEFNIGFKLPRSDTCKTCDSLNIQTEAIKDNNLNELNKLKLELEVHQRRAAAMQKSLQDEVATSNGKDIISFDLQQALPTPDLSVGPAFYLRKLWTYNLGIHDCVNKKGYMYMWSEDIAKRGSDEICSTILKYIQDHPTNNEHLIIFTDNCGGQNKNWALMSLWLQLIREKIYKTVEHRFLISGHTHLPSDRDFAVVELYKKKMKHVYEPAEWYDAVRKANRKNPFEVTEMKREQFYSFQPLVENIQKKNVHDDKEPLKFINVRCFKFDTNYPNTMFVKYLYNEEFRSVNLSKRGRPICFNLYDLKPKYDGPLQINIKKLNDLKKLLPYIPPIHHPFYNNLNGINNDIPDLSNVFETEDLE